MPTTPREATPVILNRGRRIFLDLTSRKINHADVTGIAQ